MNLPLAFISALFYLALVSVLYVAALVSVWAYRQLLRKRAPQSVSRRVALVGLLIPPLAALLPTVAGVVLRHLQGVAATGQGLSASTPVVPVHHTAACALAFERISVLASFGTASQFVTLLCGAVAWLLVAIGAWYAARLVGATYRLEAGIAPLLSEPSPRLVDALARVGKRLGLTERLRRRFFECALPPERSSVLGMLRPRCVLSQEFIETAPPEELDALVAHEAGHLRAGDVYAAFTVGVINCLFFFLRPVRLLGGWWREAAELAADDTAVRGTGNDALAVAAAILRVRSAALTAFPLPAPLLPFADEGTLSAEKRIERLLAQAESAAPTVHHETPVRVALSWAATALLATFGAGLLMSSEVACIAHCTLQLLRNLR